MHLVQILNTLTRFAGVCALLIGLALWGGRLSDLTAVHMGLGGVVVVALWTLAIFGWRRGVSTNLSVLAVVWGLATLALGVSQAGMLVGDFHWVVQTLHMLSGLGAIAIATIVVRAMAANSP